jgi:quercetin dioxygenase-like cupin family protein
MALRIVKNGSLPWMRMESAETDPSDERRRTAIMVVASETDGETLPLSRYYFVGSDSELQLFEVTFPPNEQVATHAHDSDEIIYVLEGRLMSEEADLGPGSSIYISARTPYGFHVGPDGLRFLNFRGHREMSFRA